MGRPGIPDGYSADRAGGEVAAFEVVDSDEIVAAHEPFKRQQVGTDQLAVQIQAGTGRGGRRCPLDRRGHSPVDAQAVQPAADPFPGVGVEDAVLLERLPMAFTLSGTACVAPTGILHLLQETLVDL
ncbi:hypothetical protein ACFCXH_27825 [Streptomyces nojiriensis]|uniref:hypothetical protein n=1 Tax=Streptomyces nojiriensis TaxID=66374 RepID=UPI0035DF1CEA